MGDRDELAIRALRNALRTRRSAGVRENGAIGVYDLTAKLGIEVRFWDIPSMEGMYVAGDPPVIAISSHRPSGRQRFTCAHELGHHVFGHGTRVDEYLSEAATPITRREDEWLADRFAGFLIMPKQAVLAAFGNRGWQADGCDSVQVYTVACHLGSSYQGLVTHMHRALKLISADRAARLMKRSPKDIRTSVCGESRDGELLIVDALWSPERAADVQVGDAIVLPNGCEIDGNPVKEVGAVALGQLCEAKAQGIARARLPNTSWTVYLRVSARSYVGRAAFRHLEREDDDV